MASIAPLAMFAAIAVMAVYLAIMSSPPVELAVVRSVVLHLQEGQTIRKPSPAVLMSHPSICEVNQRPDALPEELYANFLIANRDEVGPINLASLADMIAVVSFQDARRLRHLFYFTNIGERSLVGVSRVGFLGTKALICVELRGREGAFFLLEIVSGQWSIAEYHPAWIA